MKIILAFALVLAVTLCCNPTLTQNFGTTTDFLADLTITEMPGEQYSVELLTYLYNDLPAAGNSAKIACIDVESSDFTLTEDERNLDVLGISIYCNITDDPCAASGIDGASIYISTGEARYTHLDGSFNITSTRKITLDIDTARSDGKFAQASKTVSRENMLLYDMPIQGYAHHYKCYGEHDRNGWQILNTNVNGAYDDFAKDFTFDFPTQIS